MGQHLDPDLVGRSYLRVSYDRSGRERSNDEQHDDNERHATGRWALGDPYRDTGSASRFAERERGDFAQLLTDLRTTDPTARRGCRFDADVLILWESSRGSRRVGEWVELLDVCEQRGVRISVTTHDRLYDPANPRDRRSLLEDAVDSEYESAKTSARTKRGAAAGAAARRPHGRRLYGYERIYDMRTGVLLGQRLHPDEAPVVQRIYRDYLAGHGLRSISQALTAEGLRTAGGPWKESRVRDVLVNPGYVARRVWRGEDMGQADPEVWPPLIDPAVFDAVQARRAAVAARTPGARTGGQGPARRLLSGVGRCGIDHCKLTGRISSQRALVYQSACMRITRNMARLDDHVTAWLLIRLAEIITGDFDPGDVVDPRIEAARARRDALQAELDEAFAEWEAKRLSPAAYARMEQQLLPQIADAKREARPPSAPMTIDLPDDPAHLKAWWAALTAEQRREVVMAHVSMVVVHPVGKGARNYDMGESTTIEPR
jgi:DNA invertase Pin-like site-specific DNA recombinase